MQNEQPLNVLFKVLLMSDDRLRTIKEMLWETAVYLGSRLEPIQLREYALELIEAELTDAQVDFALRHIRKQPNRKRWGVPLPAEVINFVHPVPDDNDRANEIAALIQYCYGRYGYSNGADAEIRMGPEAWDVVTQKGGWLNLCKGSDRDPATEYAQLRDLARSVVKRTVQANRSKQLEAHRVERSALLSEPKLTPQQRIENKQRVADLIGSVFAPKKMEKVSS
ncbi:MAG: hypothetical protein ACRYGR_05140 [Janthinobacterium lividum]